MQPDVTKIETLADVLALVLAAPDVEARGRANMASAIRGFCRILDRTPRQVAADLTTLRQQIASASPGAVGIGPRRWDNIKTDLNRALRLAGLLRDRLTEPCSPAWLALLKDAGDQQASVTLRRFARYCTAAGIAPHDVRFATLDAYETFLAEVQLSKTPTRIRRDLQRYWNKLARTHPAHGLKPLPRDANPRQYTLSWDDLSSELAADARALRAHRARKDWFDVDSDNPALRPTSGLQYDRQLRRLASAEIHAGVPAATLTSLGALVQPDHLRAGLEFILARNGNKPSAYSFNIIMLALQIARDWAKLPDADVAQIAKWLRRLRTDRHGMTDKNRARLQQFTNRDVIQKLVRLPEQIFAQLADEPVTPTTARRAQRALMVALLTVAPIRLANLRRLDRDRHIQRCFSIAANSWQLVLPADEVKNAIDLRYPLPAHLVAMLMRYMSVYQPVLADKGSRALFPGRDGGTMSENGLRKALIDFIEGQLCLKMNPHLFRHLSALIFLQANPGQYESVRQLLGHKNIQTTISHYASFETDEAMTRYVGVLQALQAPRADAVAA